MKRFDIARFCANDEIRPALNGVCYRGGRMMASDGHMAAYVAADYGQEKEGKIINPYGGHVIEGGFPDLEKIIAKARENTVSVKLDIAQLKKACGLCVKGAFEWVAFSFTDEAGEPVRVGVKADFLKVVIHGLEAFGITWARFDAGSPQRKAILFESPDASFVLMPVMLGDDFIDMDGSISMGKATRDNLKAMRMAAEHVAAEVAETAGAIRKAKAAAKRAAAYGGLLDKAAAGVWTSEAPAVEPVKAAGRKHARGYEARNGRKLMELEAIAAADGRFGLFIRKPGNAIYKAEFKDAAGRDCVEWLAVALKNEEARRTDFAAAGAIYAGPDIQIREERRGVVYERVFTASEPQARPGAGRRGLWGLFRGWVTRVAAFAGVVSLVSGN